MNQEHNNLNPNNFNTQGNNGIPNNQPLNNQSFNQGIGVNQQPINQMNIEQPTPQPMNNIFDNGNANNQNLNSKPPKKLNLGLIIGGIAAVAVIVVGIIMVPKLFNNNSNNNNNKANTESFDSNNSTTINNKINKMDVSSEFIVSLTDSGDMYVIGKPFMEMNGKSEFSSVTLLADNVKKYANMGYYYIDNNDNLYITGVDVINGGYIGKYKKIGENIKDVAGKSNGLGLIAVSNDGELYAYGDANHNSMGIEYQELTKFENISGVKEVYSSITLSAYVTNNGELYAHSTYEAKPFTKVLDNVNEIISSENDGKIIALTSAGKIYEVDYNGEQVVASLISDIEGVIATHSNGIYYLKNGVVDDMFYFRYYPNDVKNMMYMWDPDGAVYDEEIKYLYLNNQNQISLLHVKYEDDNWNNVKNKDSKTLDYTIKNMKEIYEFIKK